MSGFSTLFSTTLPRLLAGTAIALALNIVPAQADDLGDALKSAYNNNPRIKSERKALETLDEGVSQALSGWRPTVTANYEKGRQRIRADGGPWARTPTETKGLTVTQPLFRGGGTVARTESADERVLAGRANLVGTEQQVLLDAVTAYMDVVRDSAVVDLSNSNVDVLKKQLQASRDRFSVGEVTRTDVAQSEARLARAVSEAITSVGTLKSSRATFERVIGFKPETPALPSSFPDLPASLEEALKLAKENNPSLIEAVHQEKARESDENIALAEILPEVSLRGRMSRVQGQGFAGNTDLDNDSVTVNVGVPLYQSGSEYSRVREAKARTSQSKFEMTNAHDAVRQQVTQAWERLQASISAIESDQAAIKAAEIALDGVRQEQLYGSRTVLDILDAEQELFTTRVNLARAERDRAVAVYTLLAATGQLNVKKVGVETEIYNPEEHYDDVKYQFVGF